jgi:hypothetical protein
MSGLAFQMNWPPNSGSAASNTPLPCTGLRMSSRARPWAMQELKSSTP